MTDTINVTWPWTWSDWYPDLTAGLRWARKTENGITVRVLQQQWKRHQNSSEPPYVGKYETEWRAVEVVNIV